MEPRSYLSHAARQSESGLLRDLYALNRQFISLLLAASSARAAGPLLEPYLLAKLSGLSDQQLDRLANCPYSLFDIHFADATEWGARLEHEAAVAGRLAHSSDSGGYRAAFSLCALLFARQLADSQPDLARLLLGMTHDVAQAVARLSLPALADIAFRHPQWLVARLARHPHFWPDLIDFVRDGTQERCLAAQTLGVQQSAAKL